MGKYLSYVRYNLLMNFIEVENYNLDLTLNSGQVFVWKKIDDFWYGSTVNGVIKLQQSQVQNGGLNEKKGIFWQTYPEKDNAEFIKEYLRLDDDYKIITQKIGQDVHVHKALQKFNGLRLLKQNFNETVISYIISTNKNIPAIKSSIAKLSEIYGQRLKVDGIEFFTFPNIEKLAEAKLEDLKISSIGYRAPYVLHTAQALASKNLNRDSDFQKMSEIQAREGLLKFMGVGPKVADCVLVYSLGFDNVTPLDRWGQRFLAQYYGLDPKLSYKEMRKWVQENFNGLAAWAGQYLFEMIRNG
jgi:N-glycosylase/DNA lyase